MADPAPGISAAPHEDNLRYFDVTIQGPDGSPFQSTLDDSAWLPLILMHVQVVFSGLNYSSLKSTLWHRPRYAFSPRYTILISVRAVFSRTLRNDIHHLASDKLGRICLDILKGKSSYSFLYWFPL